MRALVVDYSRAMCAILSRILQEVGFETDQAGDGEAALARLDERGRPDLLLVDWNMPGMDGLALTRNLRANPLFSDLPVIMVTTETTLPHIEEALAAGADDYVMKPFTREVILEKLELHGFLEGGG